MKADWRPRFQLKTFCQNISLKCLSPTSFHTITFTVLHHNTILCLAGTSMVVPVFIATFTERLGSGSVDDDEMKL